MEAIVGVWWAWLLGALPLLEWLLWWWNELWYAVPLRLRYSGTGTKLPPGHVGLPFFREMFKFLYFKVLRRPDEFINSKRRRYGDGAGAYRTHLFGSPSIIACSPEAAKFFYRLEDVFVLKWPNVDLVGRTSLVAVDGTAHGRIRSYISNAINKPDALRRIATAVQPRMVASLRSWAQMGRIKTFDQVKKLTFENIGKLFASLEPGPALDDMDRLFCGVVKGIRAQPLNFPGTAYHHALKCRKKLEAILRVELEKKKNHNGVQKTNDLMDGLIQMKDDEGNALSDQEVLDNIVSLVVAGYESTSLATMWAVYFLAKSPNVLQNLRDENMAMRKDKQDFFITSEDVSKLKYTNQVVEETIRMANIAAFGFRLTTQEVEYKGYVIPKNWKVVLWFRYFQTNPENFDNPMCFNPDRWNEPARPGTYQVFGGGRRICAGNMLARIQLALFLHHLSVGYWWELLNPDAGMIYLSHPKPVDGVEVKFSTL